MCLCSFLGYAALNCASNNADIEWDRVQKSTDILASLPIIDHMQNMYVFSMKKTKVSTSGETLQNTWQIAVLTTQNNCQARWWKNNDPCMFCSLGIWDSLFILILTTSTEMKKEGLLQISKGQTWNWCSLMLRSHQAFEVRSRTCIHTGRRGRELFFLFTSAHPPSTVGRCKIS